MRKVEKPDISKPSKDFSSRLIDHQCSSLEEEKAIANYLVKIRYQFSNADLLRIKGWAKYRQVSIAEILIREGYIFTFDQLIFLSDSVVHSLGDPLPIVAARNGYHLSFQEILQLNNPSDRFSATLAHWLTFTGQKFTLEELLRLGNPSIEYDEGDFYDYGYDFSVEITIAQISQEEDYSKRRYILHNGATIAHIMAREGHRFTDEEIARLGNPKDKMGLTIKDWMERVEKKFAK